MKRPAFQFYPGDWRHDTNLRLCSIAARGLWLEMLCLMHEGYPYGFLSVKGKVNHVVNQMVNHVVNQMVNHVVNHRVNLEDNLHVLVGIDKGTCESLIHELEACGVIERDSEGIIYSKRMIRDEIIREKRANSGKLGGNPSLKHDLLNHEVNQMVNHEVNQTVNHTPNQTPKQNPTPSSSSSSSSSSKEKEKIEKEKSGDVVRCSTDQPASEFSFPVEGGSRWDLSPEMQATLEQAFPATDVPAELRRASLWLEANPGRRKTSKGMPRFLNAWLARSAKQPEQPTRYSTPPPAAGAGRPSNIADVFSVVEAEARGEAA